MAGLWISTPFSVDKSVDKLLITFYPHFIHIVIHIVIHISLTPEVHVVYDLIHTYSQKSPTLITIYILININNVIYPSIDKMTFLFLD